MTEPHRHHPETGEVILEEAEPPEDAEAKAMEHAAVAQAEADVERARIEADAAVELAKIDKASEATEEQNELEALRLENAALKAQLAPPPPPEPVVVEAPAPAEEIPAGAPPEVEGSEPPKETHRRAGLGMW